MIAGLVIQTLQLKRMQECSHAKWDEAPANQHPQIGEQQCQGCGVIATEQGRKYLMSKVGFVK